MKSARPRSNLGPEFRKLCGAAALSNLGDGVALVGAPLLATTITRNPTLVAGLSFTQQIPWLLFALLSGALADRVDRQRALAAVGIFRAVLFGSIGLAVITGTATIPLLYAVLFLLTTAETFFDTASATILPKLVKATELPKANARLAGIVTITNQFLGNLLGGLLFSTAAALPFLLGSGGLAAAAILILALRGSFRVDRQVGTQPDVLWTEIVEGVRWLSRHRLLRTIAVALAILNFTLVAQNAILVLFVQEHLGVGPAGYGVLIATYGAGGVIGSLVAERIISRLGPGKTLRLALIIEATIPAAIALSSNAVLVGTLYAFFGCHAVTWGALLTSLRQELTPDELRGRVESVYRLIERGSAAPGALLGGILAAHFGLVAPFWLGTIIGTLLIPFVWSTFSDATVSRARNHAERRA